MARDIYDNITPPGTHPVPRPENDHWLIEPFHRTLECEHREPTDDGGLDLCHNIADWSVTVPFGAGGSTTRYCDEHIERSFNRWLSSMRNDRER